MLKEKTIAFTGMRPHKLPYGFDESSPICFSLKIKIREWITLLIQEENARHFISGMAMGIDQLCAEIVLDLKALYPAITLEAAVPNREQDILWPQETRDRYRAILEKCDRIYVASEKYTDDCIEKRNKYMAKKCDTVLAVWNGKLDGIGSTVKHAQKGRKTVIVIDPFEL